MEDSVKSWFEKLEKQGQDLRDKFIEASTAVSTKLDIYMSRQDDHEERLRKIEERQNKQDGTNAALRDESEQRSNRVLKWVLISEVILLIIGGLLTHFIIELK